jgi:hypothetical protein
MNNQTFKNDSDNRDDEANIKLKRALRSVWLGMRDSNPRSWNQNPLPYHLANPQCVLILVSYRR